MKKVLISIKNNDIIFSYKTNNKGINNDLINTNIISDNELVFSDVYINENTKILSSFVKELSIQYNIKNIIITKIDLALLVLKILEKVNINNLYFKEDEALTYSICETLINNKNIQNINCYTLQPFMIELLDKNNITCETRSEILYMSNFMEKNNLLKYSNIYYKNNVRIELPLTLEDIKDFEDFCKINKYLKAVHINKVVRAELENVIKILIKNNRSNIKIVIHENVNNEKIVNYLKNINKKYKKKYKIYLALEYSKEYLDKNLFKQTLINTLKVCGLIISSLVVLVVTFIGISNYVSLKQVTDIQKDLANVVQELDDVEIEKIIEEKNQENLTKAEENLDPEEEIKPEEEISPVPEVKQITNTNIAALLSVNEDVIGELKVNNTNVDYPVVQADDNDYYLDHNINKEKNSNGWIFMDYRNNPMNLDKNNIIYGHNMYYSGVMFGTLHKTANKSWYTNPENQIITYNTLYENMKFRIFSIYRVPITNDYLKVFFKDGDDFLKFIDLITSRSYYNFGVAIDKDDKILTLSTCSNNGTKRLVIHAVLIEEETTQNIEPIS